MNTQEAAAPAAPTPTRFGIILDGSKYKLARHATRADAFKVRDLYRSLGQECIACVVTESCRRGEVWVGPHANDTEDAWIWDYAFTPIEDEATNA